MYTTRLATIEDIPTLVQLWTKMTTEMSEAEGLSLPTDERIKEIAALFHSKMEEGKLIFRLATDNKGNIVACAGGLLRSDYVWPLSNETETVGWVVCVYTDVAHRKQGLAQKIVAEACDWLQSQQVVIVRLWASQHGKPTYEKLGFTPTTFMEKFI